MSENTEKIKAQLLALKSPKDGMIHAEKVVAWANKHKKSALGEQFTWDDTKAAHAFRVWQARRLIMIIVVSDDARPQLVSLRYDRSRGGGYRSVDDVIESEEFSQLMLQDAFKDLERCRERHEHVKELTSVWTEVEKVKTKVTTKTKTKRSRKSPTEQRESA